MLLCKGATWPSSAAVSTLCCLAQQHALMWPQNLPAVTQSTAKPLWSAWSTRAPASSSLLLEFATY